MNSPSSNAPSPTISTQLSPMFPILLNGITIYLVVQVKTSVIFQDFPPKIWVLFKNPSSSTFNIQLITKSCWFYVTDLFRTYSPFSTSIFISLTTGFLHIAFAKCELPFPYFSFTWSLYFYISFSAFVLVVLKVFFLDSATSKSPENLFEVENFEPHSIPNE